jgi:hypothetical protein
MKAGNFAAQIDNLSFEAKQARGQFVEPGIDAVKTLVHAPKPTA